MSKGFSPNGGHLNKKPRLSPSTYAAPFGPYPSPPGLTIANSMETLQRYVGWLRNKPSDGLSFNFEEVDVGGKTQSYATAILPSNCNVPERRIRSDNSYENTAIAKKNAAYHAVCALWSHGEIDNNLQPTPATPSKPGPPPSVLKGAPAPATLPRQQESASGPYGNARERRPEESGDMRDRIGITPEPSTSNGTGSGTPYNYIRPHEASRNEARDMLGANRSSTEHEILTHPRWWSRQPPITPEAYGAIITIEFPKRSDLDPLCRRICLVTSRPLPFGKEIPLDLPEYNTHSYRILPHVRLGASEPLRLTEDELDKAFEWTRKLVRSITNQPIDGLLEKAGYLLLPLRRKFDGATCTPRDVAWDEVSLVDGPTARDLDLRDDQVLARQLEDAVLCTHYELGRRHYVLRVRRDLTPHSPAPRRPDVSIVELTKGYSDHGPRLRYHDQPIVESEHVITASHGGWITTLNQPKPLQHLIPELLHLYFISASVLRTSTFIPSIMGALDEHLIAAECNLEVFGGKLDVGLVQQAITTPAVRPAPHNYQRLEMLGDTVLNYIASVDVYRRAEPGEEGEADESGHELRKERHLLVSNRTLAPAAAEAGLVKYVRYRAAAKRDFCPPGWVHEVEGAPDENGTIMAELGGKIPADVAEALLGAAYLSGGRTMQAALDAIQTLRIPVQLRSTDQLQAGSVLSRLLSGGSGPTGNLSILGYEFKDAPKGHAMLRLPPSAANFEQFSFLGNAVLELLTLEKLWERTELSPAELTIMKQSRVNGAALGAFAVSSGVVDKMSVSPDAEERFSAFVAEMRAAETLAEAQEQREYWTQVPEYRYLGSAFQALIGAIADDSGFDLAALRKIYTVHLAPFMGLFGPSPSISRVDARTKLQQFLQAKGCRDWAIQRGQGQYATKRVTDVLCHGVEVGHGFAHSVPQAIAAACEDALLRLPARIEAICTCVHAR